MSSTSTRVPPSPDSGIFSVSASSVIDAPRQVVWDVLMDWGSYHEWNPFVRNQCLTDASKRPLPASQQAPRAGAYLYIHPVHIPPSFEPSSFLPAGSALEMITVLEPENYRCAWENVEWPDWLMRAERWQMLTEEDGEDGRKKTRYETIEVFGGKLSYVVNVAVGNGLQKGFVAMAEGLKKRSEEKWRSLKGHVGK